MSAKYFIIVIMLILLTGYNVQKKTSIEGTWKLVSLKDLSTGTLTVTDSNANQQKIIYNNHFMFVGRLISGKDTSYNWGSGTYKLNGNIYTEKISYHSDHYLEGDEIPFEVTIRNDTLYQRGPLKSGKKQYGWDYIEAYVKAD